MQYNMPHQTTQRMNTRGTIASELEYSDIVISLRKTLEVVPLNFIVISDILFTL